MQDKTSNTLKDNFLKLPSEIICQILKLLPHDDIKDRISYISKDFYELSSRFFLNTLYARSFQFDKWRDELQHKFEGELKKFKKSHCISFFNRKDLSLLEKNGYYLKWIKHFLGCIIPLLFIYKNWNNDFPLVGKKILIIIAIIAFFMSVFLIGYEYGGIHRKNQRYLRAQITQETKDKLELLLQDYQVFLSDKELALLELPINQITNHQLMISIDQWIKEINELSKQLSDYLQKKRFSSQEVLASYNLDEMLPSLSSYTRKLATLFSSQVSEKNRIIDLLNDDDIDNKEGGVNACGRVSLNN